MTRDHNLNGKKITNRSWISLRINILSYPKKDYWNCLIIKSYVNVLDLINVESKQQKVTQHKENELVHSKLNEKII